MTQFDFKEFSRCFSNCLSYSDSFRKIGKKIGVSAPTLSRLSKGKTVDLVTAIRVADWMGVDINQFKTKSNG